jgi:hypothetical protein
MAQGIIFGSPMVMGGPSCKPPNSWAISLSNLFATSYVGSRRKADDPEGFND